MANDKDYQNMQKQEIKNPELFKGEKQTNEEIIKNGPQGIPQKGQSWADINKGGRSDIEKPGAKQMPSSYYEAINMPASEKPINQSKQIDKDIDHDKDKG